MRDPEDPWQDERAMATPTPTIGPTQAELRQRAITNCTLCDTDGYRGTTVCDHQDHRPAATRGMAKIRAALNRDETRDETTLPSTTTPETTHSSPHGPHRRQNTRL